MNDDDAVNNDQTELMLCKVRMMTSQASVLLCEARMMIPGECAVRRDVLVLMTSHEMVLLCYQGVQLAGDSELDEGYDAATITGEILVPKVFSAPAADAES